MLILLLYVFRASWGKYQMLRILFWYVCLRKHYKRYLFREVFFFCFKKTRTTWWAEFWIREFNSNYRFLRFSPYASVSDFKGHRSDFRDESINYTPKSLKSLWGHPERQQRHLLCCFSFCKQRMVLFLTSLCCFINRKTASKGSVARSKRF